MKLTKIAVAVAGLVAASQALALTPAQITTARNNGTLQQAWISGASAPTRIVYEGFAAGCTAGTIDIYTTQANSSTNVLPGSIGNYMAYSCSRGGVPSVLYHTLDGGSLLFVAPHSVGTKLARVQFPGNCTAATVGTRTLTDTTNPQNNATVYKGCTQIGANLPAAGANPTFNASNAAAYLTDPLAPNLPAGGFSDVEAALWPSSIGGGDVSAFGTQSPAFVGQVFGVVVSRPLYRAMQVAQGIAANTDALDPNFDPANAPTIDKNAYTSLIAQGGTFTDWTPLVGATAAAGKKVIVARRVETSGTQASSSAFFLNNPCGNGANASLNPLVAADSNPNLEVFEGSSTGNVKTRITTATTAGDFAIGVMSAENDWRAETATGGANGYRFIKVDGFHPETGDVANARLSANNNGYKFHMELVNFVANTAVGTFGQTVIQEITTKLGNPDASACAVLPRGLTLNPIGGSSCAIGAQVAKMTNQGNNCAPALILP